jgi:hypothetical protein
MNKDMTIKTTKIAAGYYTFQYKGQNIEITKMEMPHENNKVYWYSQINGGNANDYNNSKKSCILDAIYMLDNASEYELNLK